MHSVDVIIPCRNEVSYISQMLTAVLEQDYPTHLTQIYVVDGGSTDGTQEILEQFAKAHQNIHVLQNKERTTPKALNIGIKASSSEIVVRMDCHADYPKSYISYLVENLSLLGADNVGICLDTLPANSSDRCVGIALALSSKIGVGGSQFRTGIDQVKAVDTVPFGCYQRSVFSRIGYFDESLTRNQDDEFNSRLLKHEGKIFLLPKLRIQYFARNSYTKLAKMYYQYGMFKPLSNLKSGRVVSVRQLVPSAFVSAVALLFFAGFVLPIFWALLLGLLVVYQLLVFTSSWGLARGRGQRLQVAVATAWAVNILHFSYGIGFILGCFKVLKGWRGSEVEISR